MGTDREGVQRKRGRPPKQIRMREFPVHVYVPSQESLDTLKRAAEAEHMSLSTWARTVLMREARNVLGSESVQSVEEDSE